MLRRSISLAEGETGGLTLFLSSQGGSCGLMSQPLAQGIGTKEKKNEEDLALGRQRGARRRTGMEKPAGSPVCMWSTGRRKAWGFRNLRIREREMARVPILRNCRGLSLSPEMTPPKLDGAGLKYVDVRVAGGTLGTKKEDKNEEER